MDHVDNLIVGAGVVGLAVAAKLSETQNVVVVEQESRFGEHSSGRNSEVIHAGLYYPSDSLKAKLCVRGKELLYAHCQAYNVPHKRIGKLLLAQSDSDSEKLNGIYEQAHRNGVNELQYLTIAELTKRAPFVTASNALWSSSTGIIDSHQYLLSLLHLIEKNQGSYVANTRFIDATSCHRGFKVRLAIDDEDYKLTCSNLINAGGLFASANAKRVDGLAASYIPETLFCRGQYFAYHGKHPFTNLIYPVPEQHGLGIHATLDMSGQLKFGPDTQFIEALDYTTDEMSKDRFVHAIKQYWPQVDESRLHIDYAGIRPKLQCEGAQDFIVQGETLHGIPGLINLFGIESPGLTASLALAEFVDRLLV